MRDPTRLVNNFLVRAMVKRLGFTRARALARTLIAPIVLPPARGRYLAGRVEGYLRKYFRAMDADERRACAAAFIDHWRSKFAEDCITLSVGAADQFAAIIDRYVRYENAERLLDLLDRPGGKLIVGCHVGSPTFGTCALLGLLRSARDVPPIRICVEPETERFPSVPGLIAQVLEDYGWDVGLLFPHRDRRTIGRRMIELLDRGAIVTTNLDVLVGGSSRITLPMFGRARIYLPALIGAARVALRTGATLLPWINLRTEDGFRLAIDEPIGPLPRLEPGFAADHPEMVALCERLRSRLEGWIREYPEQWVYWDRWHYRVARSV